MIDGRGCLCRSGVVDLYNSAESVVRACAVVSVHGVRICMILFENTGDVFTCLCLGIQFASQGPKYFARRIRVN